LEASIQHESTHNQQHDQEEHEVAVVAKADAVVDPGAVVIKLSHAAVAGGAVLGADGTPDQARAAEPLRFKAVTLGQLNYHLKLTEVI
jgi:hypothetical protein